MARNSEDAGQLAEIRTALEITPGARRRDRHRKLIAHLRGVCYLGALEAYDSRSLHARCSLARLVQSCDEVLRVLMNPPKGEL